MVFFNKDQVLTIMKIANPILIVVRPNIGDIIAYIEGLHFCEEVYPYSNR